MNGFSEVKRVFFLGIGGIGMSALARYLSKSGMHVSGYDRESTTLTKKLEAEGINIVYSDELKVDVESIDVVIYTPAIGSDQFVFQYFEKRNAKMLKRSEALKEILKHKKVIAIAGTHGKTSTCALLAHICEDHDLQVTAFVGGVMSGYETNFIYGSSDWVIMEADEYDRSLWRLYPHIFVINAMDADHLDIYHTHEEVIEAFKVYSLQTQMDGVVFISDTASRYVDETWEDQLASQQIELKTFGLGEAQLQGDDLRVEDGMYQFSLDGSQVKINQPGEHNAYSTLGAIAVARRLGLSDEKIRSSLLSFQGIERRFEYKLKREKSIIIDDYAHHPVEIEKTIDAARVLYPSKKLTVVFQPHLYSRTNDFKEGFAKALDKADEVILVELYPAREEPMAGVSSETILDLMVLENKVYIKKEELEKHLLKPIRELLLFMGAGDANRYIEKVVAVY